MSRNYLEAFIVAIVAGALGFFMVLPQYQKLDDIEGKIEEKNAEIRNRQSYYANLQKIVDELGQYSDSLVKIDTAFPENPDAPDLMDFLQTAAMQSGLIMGKIEYSAQKLASRQTKEKTKNALSNYNISAQLTGNYANFKDFLSRIERSSRLAGTTKINIDNGDYGQQTGQALSGEEGGEEILNYNIKISANYYDGSQKAAANK